MTFDECERELLKIRRDQNTTSPVIRVEYGGSVFRGRLARADSDSGCRPTANSPYGVLVLEDPGLGRSPQTILQIASIEPGSIKDFSGN